MGKWSNLYQLTAWKKLRMAHLRRNPLCVKCIEAGKPQPGNTVDHTIPHRGNLELFFDPNNLQTMCAPHHNGDKQREEVRGYTIGVAEDGTPTDPKHPWNRGKTITPPESSGSLITGVD